MIQDKLDGRVPTQIYCPNCGHMNFGYKDAEGKVMFRCNRCGLVMVRTRKNRREDLLNLKIPKNQERI